MSRLCKNKGKKALFLWAKGRKLKGKPSEQERHLYKHWPHIMTHKEKCIAYAQERLQALDLAAIWSGAAFAHYYRKHNGAQGNPFFVGLNAADHIMREAAYEQPGRVAAMVH